MSTNKGGAPQNNKNAARAKLFQDSLRKIIVQEESLPEKKRRLHKAADQLLNQAAKGEEWAIKELANRLDGKAVQGVELAGPEGESLNMFDAGSLRHMSPEKVQELKSLLKEAAKQ